MTVLQEAAEASSVWVTSQVVDVDELARRVRSVLRPRTEESIRVMSPSMEALGDIVGEGVPDHVAGWIGAGYAHEGLLELSPTPDFVFCLDPWAAMLGGHSLLPEARWFYVGDLHPRRPEDAEYWAATEAWLAERLTKLPGNFVADSATKLPSGFVMHRKQPGAWEWKKRAPAGRVLTVRHAGSVLRLRVFVDALLRQIGGPPELLRIATAPPSPELLGYLDALRLAVPKLKIDLVPDESGELDEGLILPPDFLQSGRSTGRRLTLDPAVAAQILIGNLDPVPNYADLLKAHQGGPADLLRFPGPS